MSTHGGSTSVQQGNRNASVQIGRSHKSSVRGNLNETMQQGNLHTSNINGNQNLAAQIGCSNISDIKKSNISNDLSFGNRVFQKGIKISNSLTDSIGAIIWNVVEFPNSFPLQTIPQRIYDEFDRLLQVLKGMRRSNERQQRQG